jgi:AcrR family transcriptional regulator
MATSSSTEAPADATPTAHARTPRDQGMENMVAATVALLEERHPDQVTVRDVAAASGHHHRFVQAWFGGKVGLFRAAFDRINGDAAERIRASFVSKRGFEKDVLVSARLMNWLVAAEPGALDGPRPTPIIDAVVEQYQIRYGLDRATAGLMGRRLVGAAIAALLFAGPLGLEPDDVPALAELEVVLATVLARARSDETPR